MTSKISDTVEFPLVLDMSPFVVRKDERANGTWMGASMQIPRVEERSMYQLVGVVLHKGTIEHGHYYTIAMETREGNPRKG